MHKVSQAHLVPHALKSLMMVDSVSSGIVMQIYPMMQCALSEKYLSVVARFEGDADHSRPSC